MTIAHDGLHRWRPQRKRFSSRRWRRRRRRRRRRWNRVADTRKTTDGRSCSTSRLCRWRGRWCNSSLIILLRDELGFRCKLHLEFVDLLAEVGNLLILLCQAVNRAASHHLSVDFGIAFIGLSALFSGSEARVDRFECTLEVDYLLVLDADCGL